MSVDHQKREKLSLFDGSTTPSTNPGLRHRNKIMAQP